MKIYFLTFADSSLTPTLKRIKLQAKAMNVFDKLFVYNEHRIPTFLKRRNQENWNPQKLFGLIILLYRLRMLF